MGISASPHIGALSWGRLEVEGASEPYKDAKVFPGGSREWDWNETGTRHEPGIQPADVEELLARGATRIILSRGMNERLRVCPETLALLEGRGVAVEVLQTQRAVQRYNEARKSEAVGGLFHSTC